MFTTALRVCRERQLGQNKVSETARLTDTHLLALKHLPCDAYVKLFLQGHSRSSVLQPVLWWEGRTRAGSSVFDLPAMRRRKAAADIQHVAFRQLGLHSSQVQSHVYITGLRLHHTALRASLSFPSLCWTGRVFAGWLTPFPEPTLLTGTGLQARADSRGWRGFFLTVTQVAAGRKH